MRVHHLSSNPLSSHWQSSKIQPDRVLRLDLRQVVLQSTSPKPWRSGLSTLHSAAYRSCQTSSWLKCCQLTLRCCGRHPSHRVSLLHQSNAVRTRSETCRSSQPKAGTKSTMARTTYLSSAPPGKADQGKWRKTSTQTLWNCEVAGFFRHRVRQRDMCHMRRASTVLTSTADWLWLLYNLWPWVLWSSSSSCHCNPGPCSQSWRPPLSAQPRPQKKVEFHAMQAASSNFIRTLALSLTWKRESTTLAFTASSDAMQHAATSARSSEPKVWGKRKPLEVITSSLKRGGCEITSKGTASTSVSVISCVGASTSCEACSKSKSVGMEVAKMLLRFDSSTSPFSSGHTETFRPESVKRMPADFPLTFRLRSHLVSLEPLLEMKLGPAPITKSSFTWYW